jgi:oligopeptidase A
MLINPFLDVSFPPAWSKLLPANVVADITLAVERAQAKVDAIAAQSPDRLSYESTILALESSTEELNAAWAKVGHLQSVADSAALREAHNAVLPKVTAFYAGIPLNAALWVRVRTVAETPAVRALTGVHRRLVDETIADFRQAGADLPLEKRQRLEALQSELAQITQRYSENVLDGTNKWELVIDDERRLAGLPAHAAAAARRSAEAKQLGTPERPVWRFTLHMPSQEPFMTYLEDSALRREMWTAAAAVGTAAPHDNTELIRRILNLRAEKAALLGQADFADLVLARRMAKTGARALAFLEDFQERAAPAFARECGELEEFKARNTGSSEVGRLAPWELAFWSERLRRERYAFDEEILRPYFPMAGVIAGLFELVNRIFGLQVKECAPGTFETWHAEVKFYEMHDRDGRHLGSFYADWHPRESKRGGAWMGSLITGGPTSTGGRAPHLGYICGNLTPPNGLRPALLTHREVETVFHEFGHLLHHLLGEVEIKSLNGTNVAWDFVELPSQIMENWCWERASLDLFARHFETGARIPDEIFAKLTAAKNFRAACATMRQVAFAKMDLLLHRRTAAWSEGEDVEPVARALIAECLTPTEPPAPTIVKRFNHLFSDPVGYAAGYYSYKWAEVLDADAFSRFRSEGIFSAEVGREFVEKILSRGNSADPLELFRDFMGRDPEIAALLKRSGLAAA